MSSEQLIANELLAFIQHAIDTMDEISIMQICKSNFKVEEICKGKVLLYETLGRADRMPTRRRDENGERSLQDIISLVKSTDPDDVPAFVAKGLHKLPPVTFDHVDVTRLLKDINALKAGLAEVQLKLEISETTVASFIQQRYVLGIMGLLAHANSLGMRMTLSLAITQMVSHVASSTQQISGETCPDPSDVSETSANRSSVPHHFQRDYQLYNWDESTQGFILSSSYYGVLLTNIPSGYLAEKTGGKWIVFNGLLVSSLATFITPWMVQIGGATGLVIMRVIKGIGEGAVVPSLLVMTSRWVPPTERSTFAALMFGGAQIGHIIVPYLSGLILGTGAHWSYIFYIFGMCGVAWCMFWVILCYNNPNVHPFISEEEQNMLNETVVSSTLNKRLDPVPLRAILTSKPLWALVIAFGGHAFGHLIVLTMLPKYFLDVLKFNIKETGLRTALPFLALLIASFICGAMCDFATKKNWHSIETGRKIYVSMSSGVSAVFMILASYSGCDRVQAVTYLALSVATMGAYYCSTKINSIDLAPNYAGTCSGIMATIGSLTGIIAPTLVGLMTPDQTIEQWRAVFWMIFAILVGSNLVYIVWGKADQQWWDDVDKFGYPATWTGGPFKVRPSDGKQKTVVRTEKIAITVDKF